MNRFPGHRMHYLRDRLTQIATEMDRISDLRELTDADLDQYESLEKESDGLVGEYRNMQCGVRNN